MGKILGSHEVRLRERVSGEEFERFVREEASKIPFPAPEEGDLLRRSVDHSGEEYLIVWATDAKRYPYGYPEALVKCEKWRSHHTDLWTTWRDYMDTAAEEVSITDYTVFAEL